MSRQFPVHTLESAPDASKKLLAEQRERFGFVPAPLARIAESPVALSAALAGFQALEESALSPAEREIVAFVVGRANRCGYCMALHTALAARNAEVAPHVAGLREGRRPGAPRLAALFDFTRAVLETRGDPGDAAFATFLAAGYTWRQALDVVLGIGVYTLSTFANRLVEAPLDPFLEPHRWAEAG